jgi:hypothetical protein
VQRRKITYRAGGEARFGILRSVIGLDLINAAGQRPPSWIQR